MQDRESLLNQHNVEIVQGDTLIQSATVSTLIPLNLVETYFKPLIGANDSHTLKNENANVTSSKIRSHCNLASETSQETS